MSQARKRRATDLNSPGSQTRNQRPRSTPDSDAEVSDGDAPSNTDAMVRKMVRLALACEYARLPIRRPDISTKVLGEQGSRQFKLVFETAQKHLRSKFGMEMTELPAREKLTITQRRAAQKTEKPSSTNKSWVLTSTLPAKYRNMSILAPPKAPSTSTESAYTAIYTFLISVITLNGGSLAEHKLDRYLARMNADENTPFDRKDKVMARLRREGYLVRHEEKDGDENRVEYTVGPRGKIEVGTSGVAGLVREVYGRSEGDGNGTQAEREDRAEFEAKLRRSLGITEVYRPQEEEVEQEQRVDEGPRRSSRRAATNAAEESESEQDSD
ncbi:hypothetical protein N7462_006962 [Penicillium macrosclerotiorum]|uniref:uncharacterized protein n=1 Tax=Penicillium macrosclerotiorum TaxID=303699 RepID=UPI002546F876|nr:uncharacterized protein N7462_006962 [Penicillium macrosclerotiorum]KAJ5678718.1 hypothetical protein N7462_006962 [Penicillium macrosclerotiorum]